MNGHDDETTRLDRRRLLQLLGAGLGASSAVLALAGRTARAEAGAGVSCKSKVPIDPAAAQVRRVLQYMEKSSVPGKRCENCLQYEAGKYKECGGCKLFAGAVHPAGYCLSWAAKPST